MAAPTPYNRFRNFQNQQALAPTTPLNGADVDEEYNRVKITTDSLIAGLGDIRRDDGALKNGVVGPDQLSDSLVIGFTLRGPWEEGANYLLNDGVTTDDAKFYRATAAALSTAGNAPGEVDAPWVLVADFSADLAAAQAAQAAAEAAAVATAADAVATAADAVATAADRVQTGLDAAATAADRVQTGLDAAATAADAVATAADRVQTGLDVVAAAASAAAAAASAAEAEVGLADGDVTNAKLANMAEATIKGRAAGAGTGAPVDLTAEQVRAIVGEGVPAGSIIWYAANAAPTGYLKANGAAVSRTTYAALFTAIGTTFGTGDGSTTFNLPDLRGEFIRGWDDGRGVDAARAFGSAQADELESHTHAQAAATILSTAGATINVSGDVTRAIGGTTGATGGAETRPRNIALLACIKF